MHPLLGDISTLTDTELQEKLSTLQKRYIQASRLGYSSALDQLRLLITDFQEEQTKRKVKVYTEMLDKDKEFKNIIDVS